MNPLLVLVVVASFGSPAVECVVGNRVPDGALPPRPLLVAQGSPLEAQKLATIAETEGEVRTLSLDLERISRITPTEGGANPAFAQAKKVFDEKLGLLRKQLDALRTTPADAAQGATYAVNAALQELRAAYSQAVDAAP